ncbi:MAG: hypothetical protein QNJ72_05890 [Pleurocapsa sp. MO_226.B13]|nr:hypothetical protein [Pleurocapsa sp. MO_226.B13]
MPNSQRKSSINIAFIASWLFFLGSAIFTIEAALEAIAVSSLLSFVHFLACLFFSVGSLLFVYDTKK